MFVRDPVILFQETLHLDDTKDTNHFENINSTNWQSMRFKPPPVKSNIGWRVEFRPTEVRLNNQKRFFNEIFSFLIQLQMTDFENAAFVTFIVLLTRAIMTYNLNLLLPISLVSKKDMENKSKLIDV